MIDPKLSETEEENLADSGGGAVGIQTTDPSENPEEDPLSENSGGKGG